MNHKHLLLAAGALPAKAPGPQPKARHVFCAVVSADGSCVLDVTMVRASGGSTQPFIDRSRAVVAGQEPHDEFAGAIAVDIAAAPRFDFAAWLDPRRPD